MTPAKEWPHGPLVLGRDDAIAKFVTRRLKEPRGFGKCAAIGVIRNDKLCGGVVYYDFHPEIGTIEVAFAFDAPSWITPDVLCSLFTYPFVTLKCQRMTAIVAKRNKRSRRFVEGVGFTFEGKARRGFGKDDAMIYGMLIEECRWLEKKTDGQEIRAVASASA